MACLAARRSRKWVYARHKHGLLQLRRPLPRLMELAANFKDLSRNAA
jgi:hypothetical protein